MKRARGFTIIEFMIAMTLSLLVLAALTAAFVASSRSRAEIEKANEQIENGRYALQLLTDDLEVAGFFSKLDIDLALTADTRLPIPTDKPDPCMGAADPASLDALEAAMPMHIQGYDSPAAVPAELDCLADVKLNTDIVLVRRTATCVDGGANCPTVAGAAYLEASLCAEELDSLNYDEYFDLDTSDANLNRKQRDCATEAEKRQYLVHIYFIANNDVAGDGVPTLKRAELGNSASATGFTVVPLARGIADLQIEYGIDSSGDGQPDIFTASPDTHDTDGSGAAADCAAHKTECIANWRNVMSLRLNLLASNTSTSPDHQDAKVYVLGKNDDGTDRCARDANADGACEAFNDGFKRHVYQTSVRLINPAGRRES
jgi:type IV pilus assembly protein PilW